MNSEFWKSNYSCVNRCSNDKVGSVFCIVLLVATKSEYNMVIQNDDNGEVSKSIIDPFLGAHALHFRGQLGVVHYY